MRHIKEKALFFALIPAIFLVSTATAENKEIKKTFPEKKVVKISTITTNCVVIKGKSGEITVHLSYTDAGKLFKPVIEEEADSLLIREKIPASDSAVWKVFVPDNTEIDFKSAAGSFWAKGLQGDISASTAAADISVSNCRGKLVLKNASGEVKVEYHKGDVNIKAVSGDIRVKKISGEIRIKSLSGDIEAQDLEGSVDLKFTSGDIDVIKAAAAIKASCVSGDLEASDIVLKGESSFKVVSGDIYLKLSKSLDYNLTLDSASGNVVLNFNGNPVKGLFEFRARAEMGKIVSPFKFDKEEETYKYGKKYLVKSFKRGGATPKIILKTASGTVILER
jgi:hypothetical protein